MILVGDDRQLEQFEEWFSKTNPIDYYCSICFALLNLTDSTNKIDKIENIPENVKILDLSENKIKLINYLVNYQYIQFDIFHGLKSNLLASKRNLLPKRIVPML